VERHGTQPHRLATERHRRCHRRLGRSETRKGRGRRAPPADLRGSARPIRNASPRAQRGTSPTTRPVSPCEPASARDPLAGVHRRRRASSTPRAMRSRPRSSSGLGGPGPRRTGSIRSCDAAIRSWTHRSWQLRATGEFESSTPDDVLTFKRFVVSGIERRTVPNADIRVDLWAGPVRDPTLLSGDPYLRRRTGIAAESPDRSR
jgi:hypothetical protein